MFHELNKLQICIIWKKIYSYYNFFLSLIIIAGIFMVVKWGVTLLASALLQQPWGCLSLCSPFPLLLLLHWFSVLFFLFFTCAAGEGREGEGRQREERKQEKQKTGDDTKWGEEGKQEMDGERRGEWRKKSKRRRKLLGSRSEISYSSLSMGTVSSSHCHTTKHKVEYAHRVTHTQYTHPSLSCRAVYYTSILLTFKTWMLHLSESPQAFYLYPFFRTPLRQNP